MTHFLRQNMLIHPNSGSVLATIALQSDHLATAAEACHGHTVRQFELVRGDIHQLRRFWYGQSQLIIREPNGGQPSKVRIAAIPSDIGEHGFIEYLSL